jgi:hypothetical protein
VLLFVVVRLHANVIEQVMDQGLEFLRLGFESELADLPMLLPLPLTHIILHVMEEVIDICPGAANGLTDFLAVSGARPFWRSKTPP